LSRRQFTKEFKLAVAQGVWVHVRFFCVGMPTKLAAGPFDSVENGVLREAILVFRGDLRNQTLTVQF